jgi:hypothetical protein
LRDIFNVYTFGFGQKEVCFYITPFDPAITRSQPQDSIGYSDIRQREAWPGKGGDVFGTEVPSSDIVEIPLSDIAVGK